MNADRTAVLTVGDRTYHYQPLDGVLAPAELDDVPYAVRVLLENVARRTPEALADVVARTRAGSTSGACEVPVRPNRIMLHDTTCLPALADFAAMRDCVAELGGDPEELQPSVPVDLTVDHSVIVEEYGRPDAVERNLLIDFRRNGERYEMVKWAEKSVANFRVVPPGTGIIHQINMEALARVVWRQDTDDGPLLHPDVLVATDSHTPMINALGVVGWGVGGLEGQAAMLGEPVTIPYPEVVGVRLTGRLRQGVGATDLALTLTELLRATGVVNKFVEFCGEGVTTLGWAERAAVSNMAPEYGATCVFFPYDEETAHDLRLSGRDEEHVALVDAYLTAQGLKRTDDRPVPRYDQLLDLDLATVEPSVAGPHLPHPADTGTVSVELGTTGRQLKVVRTKGVRSGRQVTVGLRSERITLAAHVDAPTDGVNVLSARIEQCSYTGARFEYELSVDGLRLRAESPVRHEGDTLNLLIRPEDCLLYPSDTAA
ncbi:aconitase family protein [Streptomyces sp. WG-D5]